MYGLTYASFIEQCMKFFNSLPETEYANLLPQKYFTGFRGWDSYKIFEWGELKKTDWVLDTGAWQTFFCLYLAKFVSCVDATDNFYWAKRDFVKEYHLQGAQEWMDCIQRLDDELYGRDAKKGSVFPFELDVQNINPNYIRSTGVNGGYDKILSISTIEHVIDDKQAMESMYEVLKPGGILLLTTEFDKTRGKDYSEEDGSFYRVYSEKTLQDLVNPYPVIHSEVMPWTGPHYFTTAFVCIEKEK